MKSKLTFRKIDYSEAYQHKIRKQKEKDWIKKGRPKFWDKLDLNLNKAIIKEIDRITAKKIILEYEWLGDMALTNKFYGIFFDIYCAGVICINTQGQACQSEMQFGLKKGEVAYFARGACVFWSPVSTASRLLSYALKLEKKRGAKLAIAFVDKNAGEYGTVYQATNWLFLGFEDYAKRFQFYKNNRVLDTRTFTHQAMQKKITTITYKKYLLNNGWKMQPTEPKGKYVFILANEPEKSNILNRIKNKIQPYPKRAPVV